MIRWNLHAIAALFQLSINEDVHVMFPSWIRKVTDSVMSHGEQNILWSS